MKMLRELFLIPIKLFRNIWLINCPVLIWYQNKIILVTKRNCLQQLGVITSEKKLCFADISITFKCFQLSKTDILHDILIRQAWACHYHIVMLNQKQTLTARVTAQMISSISKYDAKEHAVSKGRTRQLTHVCTTYNGSRACPMSDRQAIIS